MGSREKVLAAFDRIESVADAPDAPPMVRGGAAMFSMGRRNIERMLPDTDAELDELLERGSQWMLDLRSDA